MPGCMSIDTSPISERLSRERALVELVFALERQRHEHAVGLIGTFVERDGEDFADPDAALADADPFAARQAPRRSAP